VDYSSRAKSSNIRDFFVTRTQYVLEFGRLAALNLLNLVILLLVVLVIVLVLLVHRHHGHA